MECEYLTLTSVDPWGRWLAIDREYGFMLSTAACGDMGPSGKPAGGRDRILRESRYAPKSVLGVQQVHSREVVDYLEPGAGGPSATYREPRADHEPAAGGLQPEPDHAAVADHEPAGGGLQPEAGSAPGVDHGSGEPRAGRPSATDREPRADREPAGGGLQPEPDHAPVADGMLFNPYRAAAAVTVADCMPILLVASSAPVAALLHSGYRGTGIVSVALDLMRQRAGIKPEEVTAVLGPCIAGGCYAVPRERAEAFRRDFGVDAARHDGNGSFIDMRSANLSLLEAAGVRRVRSVAVCTHCDRRLGSYRRDASDFFRMLAIAGPFRE